MPGLPEIPQVPSLPHAAGQLSTLALSDWVRAFSVAFHRLWVNMTYTYNALLRADTLSNRAATPDLNESAFVASDTKQLFVGVNGAWENAGPRRGSVSVSGGATTATVTLSPSEPDTNYHVVATARGNMGALWISSPAVGSFVVNVASAPVGATDVDWALFRT